MEVSLYVAITSNEEIIFPSLFNKFRILQKISGKLDYGMLGVNDPDPFAVQAPFGGVKQSGLGREGNKYGVEDCLETNEI